MAVHAGKAENAAFTFVISQLEFAICEECCAIAVDNGACVHQSALKRTKTSGEREEAVLFPAVEGFCLFICCTWLVHELGTYLWTSGMMQTTKLS